MTRLIVVTSLNRMVPLLGAEMPNATVHRRFGQFAQQAGDVHAVLFRWLCGA